MNALTIWIILGIVHVMLTTLFIIKSDWFSPSNKFNAYLNALTMSTGIISIAILIRWLLSQYGIAILWISVVLGLPIGIAWLIKKVRK